MRLIAWVPTTAIAWAIAGGVGRADTITLDAAIARAAKRPAVQMAEAEVDATRATAAGARRPIHNPELGAAAGPRLAGGRVGVEAEASIAQTIELGGKRDARTAAAEARTRAASAALAVAARAAELDTRRAFQLALVAQARVEAAHEAEELAAQMESAIGERQKLGAGTQLESNLATVEVGRARHDRVDAENQYEEALAALATAIGAGPDERLEPSGALAELPAPRWSEAALIERAIERRPELAQVRAEHDVARAEVRLADAMARPDLTVGLAYGLERDVELTAHALVVTASIALPVRNRNQGERSATRARLRRASLEEARERDEGVRAARLALRNYTRARDAVLGFDQQVNDRLHENLVLARESFESGKIDYLQFNVVRRELIASRGAYLDAVREAVDAAHALARAAGEGGTP